MSEPQHHTSDEADGFPNHQELKREAIEFVKLVVWFLVLFVVVRTYVIEGYEVQGVSMEPSLADRERILVFKLPHELSKFFRFVDPIKPGDIIVFMSEEGENRRYVKRVIAEGAPKRSSNVAGAAGTGPRNDMTSVRYEDGTVYVNNRRLSEDYIAANAHDLADSYEETLVGPGQYYVLGDNRTISKDSRSFGPISDGEIIGHAVFRFWPLHKMGFLK